MKKNKAYKYRIYPTPLQKELLAKTFGCVRFIYNKMLADKIDHYQLTKKSLSNTPAQYKNFYPFLKDVDSLALANAQLNLQTAYRNFFSQKNAGFPRFKSKKKEASYTTNKVNGNIAVINNAIKLPKVGYLKAKLHRQLPKNVVIKSVTVRKTATGKYYASILVEYEELKSQSAPITEKKTLGLDYSSSSVYMDSEGNSSNYDQYYRKSEQKLARLQRNLSRKKTGSANYAKQRRKVAGLHEKIACQRLDFLHKQSTAIAKQYDAVCVEEINLRGIARGLHLGKATYDNGFGLFRTLLKYKLEDQGKHFVVIGRWYPSSKTCSCCGHINPDLKAVRSDLLLPKVQPQNRPGPQRCYQYQIRRAADLWIWFNSLTHIRYRRNCEILKPVESV